MAGLLRLMVEIAAQRNDPRAWRGRLLEAVREMLPASAAAAFILKEVGTGSEPVVASVFDSGFDVMRGAGAGREAFLEEFNGAPFRDIFSRRVLEKLLGSRAQMVTAARSELTGLGEIEAEPGTQRLRQRAGVDDCLLSVQRGAARGTVYALYAFRPRVEAGTGVGGGGGASDLLRPFGAAERGLLDVLHAGLEGIYRFEEATHRLNRADELPPRLRQTLDLLLEGHTERQVALKLTLSVHTVHDYVKALYAHFAVSSRGELVRKCMQLGGGGMPRGGENPG